MASHPIYQFYAELSEYEPKIWRRFQVTDDVTMARLGYIIMSMFEMQASHLFCFDISFAENYKIRHGDDSDSKENLMLMKKLYGKPEKFDIHVELSSEDDGDEFGFRGRLMYADKTRIKGCVNRENEHMVFSYDYGDGWEVNLILEKIFEDKELPGKELPRILDGAGYGIIEDCGGASGLEDIVKAFKEKKGSEYEQYREWLGVDELDLSSFDIADANFRIKKVPRIYCDLYEHNLEPTKQSMDLLTRKYKK